MAADSPNRYVATVTKSKRRGKILVDYLRNSRGATAVAPYSTRARPGAPVSMPLAWDELGPGIGPGLFHRGECMPTRLGQPDRPTHGRISARRPCRYQPMAVRKGGTAYIAICGLASRRRCSCAGRP